jgi:hypothetical protein
MMSWPWGDIGRAAVRAKRKFRAAKSAMKLTQQEFLGRIL